MQEQHKYLQEDEIDLRELFKTLWAKKIFIVIFTSLVTIAVIVYTFVNNPIPEYRGTVMIEIGEVKAENGDMIPLDNVNNLAKILSKKFSIKASVPRRTDTILVITSSNKNTKVIEKNINVAIDFIIARHNEKVKLYEHYIMTKKVGNIEISKQPINQPKKKPIVIAAFIIGFILSIFLVFFIEFIRSFKEEESIEAK